MQVTFVILILCWSLHISTSHPPIPEWRQSRFIIDNRRNALFTHREPTALETDKNFFRFPAAGKLFPPVRYQKDLSAEASIREPSYLEKYKDNSLPVEVAKTQVKAIGYNDFERNVTAVDYDPHSLVQGDENAVKIVAGTSTENQSWVPKIEENVLESSSTTSGEAEGLREETTRRQNLGYGRTPWGIKTEEANQIEGREKHVYETRIETVSYHQEVILNPTRSETNTEEWYGRKVMQENKNYNGGQENSTRQEPYQERNFEEPEKNYEEPERNYEEPERNYEKPERNYKEPEMNYEEPERNYEEPERNYEEPERNYEESERNYEQNESSHTGKAYPPETDENKNQLSYVVEGRNFRKYRVEERTADGFIVGEYGVVSHDDGTLHGVRYTADSTTNPQLIYDALLKFLSL